MKEKNKEIIEGTLIIFAFLILFYGIFTGVNFKSRNTEHKDDLINYHIKQKSAYLYYLKKSKQDIYGDFIYCSDFKDNKIGDSVLYFEVHNQMFSKVRNYIVFNPRKYNRDITIKEVLNKNKEVISYCSIGEKSSNVR